LTSLLLGLLLATIALAIFVLEKSNRGLRGLNGSEESAFHPRYPRYLSRRSLVRRRISDSTILQIFLKCPSTKA